MHTLKLQQSRYAKPALLEERTAIGYRHLNNRPKEDFLSDRIPITPQAKKHEHKITKPKSVYMV